VDFLLANDVMDDREDAALLVDEMAAKRAPYDPHRGYGTADLA
jgi:hypothetical protein